MTTKVQAASTSGVRLLRRTTGLVNTVKLPLENSCIINQSDSIIKTCLLLYVRTITTDFNASHNVTPTKTGWTLTADEHLNVISESHLHLMSCSYLCCSRRTQAIHLPLSHLQAAEPKKATSAPGAAAAGAAGGAAAETKEEPKAGAKSSEAGVDNKQASAASQAGDDAANVPKKLEKRNSIHLFFKNLVSSTGVIHCVNPDNTLLHMLYLSCMIISTRWQQQLTGQIKVDEASSSCYTS